MITSAPSEQKGTGDKMENRTATAGVNMDHYNRHPLQKLWNYEGVIYDMGLEPDTNMNPAFYILTEEGEHISVSVIRPQEIGRVNQWLNRLNTGVHVEFTNYTSWNYIIKRVFRTYCRRYGLLMHFDNTVLNRHMTTLKNLSVSEVQVAKEAGVGVSTLNDLTRGITTRPRFFTVCSIFSAIYQIEQDHLKKHQ